MDKYERALMQKIEKRLKETRDEQLRVDLVAESQGIKPYHVYNPWLEYLTEEEIKEIDQTHGCGD